MHAAIFFKCDCSVFADWYHPMSHCSYRRHWWCAFSWLIWIILSSSGQRITSTKENSSVSHYLHWLPKWHYPYNVHSVDFQTRRAAKPSVLPARRKRACKTQELLDQSYQIFIRRRWITDGVSACISVAIFLSRPLWNVSLLNEGGYANFCRFAPKIDYRMAMSLERKVGHIDHAYPYLYLSWNSEIIGL